MTYEFRRSVGSAVIWRTTEAEPDPIVGAPRPAWTVRTGGRGRARVAGQQPSAGADAAEIGQATETDTALALKATQARTIGQAAETDSAQPIGISQVRTLGQATETDSAQPIGSSQVKIVNQAAETDEAQPVSVFVPGILNQAVETDSAQPIAIGRVLQVGQALGVDEAQPIALEQIQGIGQATETDEAIGITSLYSISILIGQVHETDLAQPITPSGGGGFDTYPLMGMRSPYPLSSNQLYPLGTS